MSLGDELSGIDTITDSGGTADLITSTVSRNLSDLRQHREPRHCWARRLIGVGNNLANLITGNAFNNTLTGAGGNDVLNGGAGSDSLNGGIGNDIYVLADGTDTVTDSAGIDRMTSTVSRSLSTYAAIENLTLLGSALIGVGNNLGNLIIGNAFNNTLIGAGGNDVLDGGGGSDSLNGGTGNDTYRPCRRHRHDHQFGRSRPRDLDGLAQPFDLRKH